MKRLTFSVEVDEVLNVLHVDNSDSIFKGEGARGKKFLLVDPVNNSMMIAHCSIPSSDTDKYAKVEYYPIPATGKLLDDAMADLTDMLMGQIKSVGEKICSEINDSYNGMAVLIGKEIDDLKSECLGGGNGISEKTLLSALEIVTKAKQ